MQLIYNDIIHLRFSKFTVKTLNDIISNELSISFKIGKTAFRSTEKSIVNLLINQNLSFGSTFLRLRKRPSRILSTYIG